MSTATSFTYTNVSGLVRIVLAVDNGPGASPVSINWGDGSTNDPIINNSSYQEYTHTYSSLGNYTVTIDDTISNPNYIIYGFIYDGITTARDGIDKLTSFTFGSNLTLVYGAFFNATNFTTLTNTLPPAVTDTSGMFYGATNFNQDISGWDVSNVTNLALMFSGATLFNRSLANWDVRNCTLFINMLDSCGMSQTNFDATLTGWANLPSPYLQPSLTLGAAGLKYTSGLPAYTTLTASPANVPTAFNWTIFADPAPAICFGEGSKILCFKDNKEVYIPIENIRKGDLVKTYKFGYKPVDMIGTSKIYNSGYERIPDRLYRCSKEKYPELNEDLILTGYHSILVDNLTPEQREKTISLMKRIFVTTGKYRLIACIDERAEPYKKQGLFNIYHLAIEHEDYFKNYGIYANGGLLVETTSKRFMNELSGMTLLE